MITPPLPSARFAGLISLTILVAGFAGCAAGASDAPARIAPHRSRATSADDVFVTLRRDPRLCIAPVCGGYWLKTLNIDNPEQYVSGLDFSTSGLSDADIQKAREAPGAELILSGVLGDPDPRFGTRKLVVSAAYRGMPGVVAGKGETFYVETAASCGLPTCDVVAKVLNVDDSAPFDSTSVARASKGFVDQDWLTSRVEAHGALVAATVDATDPTNVVVDASQVFVRLPERVGPCPLLPVVKCADGQLTTYTRTTDRCVVFDQCIDRGGPCPLFFPRCEDGYSLASWPAAPNGCSAYACDPTFAVK